ncbi:MAG: SMC-Scp complex subunit ScpB [Firmicutes bacterium]|nr:SMC-Scp complex subunit ScpB [Bacillota bacterium]
MPSLKTEQQLTTTALIEAALFLSREALSLKKLTEICAVNLKEIKNSLKIIKTELEKNERGLVLLETPAGYRLGTKPETATYLEKFWEEENAEPPLSEAALETLAIVALKQPVTRMEIEKIRGVGAGGVLENLLKRDLVNIIGRKESLGRPLLYGVTETFMQHFGFKDLKELQEKLENINP